MTDEEKFSFDLEGYLVVKDVLTQDEMKPLNAVADRFASENGDPGTSTISRVSQWSPGFQALMDHHKIVPYLVELLGPKFRIDHDYCIFMKKGAERGGLHGGETDTEADHWYNYRDGVMRNGLTVVTYFLSPAGPGDGGFACIPGSHKSNFVDRLPRDVRKFERDAHYVVQPEATPATHSSSRRPLSTGRSHGRPITIAGPCYTNTAPDTPPGPRDTTTPVNTPASQISSGDSWRLRRSGDDRIPLRRETAFTTHHRQTDPTDDNSRSIRSRVLRTRYQQEIQQCPRTNPVRCLSTENGSNPTAP